MKCHSIVLIHPYYWRSNNFCSLSICTSFFMPVHVLPIFLFLKLLFFFYISSLFISLFALLSRSFIVKVCSTYPLYLNYATYVQIMTPSSTTPMHRMSQLEQCSFSSVPHLISARRLEWDSSSVVLILWGHLKSYLFHKVSSNYTGFFNSLTSQYQGIHNITLHQFK